MAKEYRVNQRIRSSSVRLISGDDQSNSKILKTTEALQMAMENGLDLVEVSPNQDPPVCRLLDYGKFKYNLSKRDKKNRSKTTQTQREVRLRPGTSKHDVELKIKKVRSLLDDGSKVRVAVMLRGREAAHPDFAMKVLRSVAEGVKDMAKLDKRPSNEGRTLSLVVSPALPQGTMKNKEKEKE
ncbi:MAG: translation initiation factor IF-3 [SAR202 cluster bacterium]|nr:translation initiation factor IF-3 [SAR202 cluster bacterium]RZP16940.1 MAG: translation initiation factor IF-3 [Chloroflexota bacterium]